MSQITLFLLKMKPQQDHMEHPIERLILCMMLTLMIGCGAHYSTTVNGTILPNKPRFTIKGLYQLDSITSRLDTNSIYEMVETISWGSDTVVPYFRFFSNGRVLVGSYLKREYHDSVYNTTQSGYVGYYASHKGKLQIEFYGHIDYSRKGKYIKTDILLLKDQLKVIKEKMGRAVRRNPRENFLKKKVNLKPMIVDW
jgi:hypothetical protein